MRDEIEKKFLEQELIIAKALTRLPYDLGEGAWGESARHECISEFRDALKKLDDLEKAEKNGR